MQEYEYRSRCTKLAWAEAAGARWLNLQHDGVVIQLGDGMSEQEACASMREWCSAALGYDQPVDTKEMVHGVMPGVCWQGAWRDARVPVAETRWAGRVVHAVGRATQGMEHGEVRRVLTYDTVVTAAEGGIAMRGLAAHVPVGAGEEAVRRASARRRRRYCGLSRSPECKV